VYKRQNWPRPAWSRIYTDDQDRERHRLTADGGRVARQLAMPEKAGQDDLMEALLGNASSPLGTAEPSGRR
jgi:hypothetical protein